MYYLKFLNDVTHVFLLSTKCELTNSLKLLMNLIFARVYQASLPVLYSYVMLIKLVYSSSLRVAEEIKL
jgi:hypothetical protein